MKETTRTSRTAGYIEKMFRTINKDSFNNEIPEPIITLKNTEAYGHCTTNKTWNRKDEEAYEINISTMYLSRPIEHLVATLIHEMVHLYNIEKGIKDTSRGNVYHNKKFKEEAEKHMLKIEQDDKYGWTITQPTIELIDYIIDNGWTEIMMNDSPDFAGLFGGNNGTQKGKSTPKGKTTSNSIKHVCPKCGNIARTTKAYDLICGECNIKMEV